MKVLVTGGGGFLGLYIVEQLIAAGQTVFIFVYFSVQPISIDIFKASYIAKKTFKSYIKKDETQSSL